MVLNEVTPIPEAALPLAEFRAHLRLGSGFGPHTLQDEVLSGFLRAAIVAIEGQIGKSLIVREFNLELSAWDDPSGQRLPVAPVIEVSDVVMVNRTGEETVVDRACYAVSRDNHQPVLCPVGGALPCIPVIGTVRVRMHAGLAPGWGELPADLGQAVLLLAAYYYEQRAETGIAGGWMPYGVTSLLRRYRPMRLSARAV
ncbi:MAG: hypothetical protein AB3N23_19250 [Paracoccaceae bacterium]